jgi:hypothetical protein
LEALLPELGLKESSEEHRSVGGWRISLRVEEPVSVERLRRRFGPILPLALFYI